MSQEVHESESICLIGADGGTLRAEAAPHSVPELIGPIIRRLIETKRRTAIDLSSSPPPAPSPTKDEPTSSSIDKGSKGPQATPEVVHAKRRARKKRLGMMGKG